MRQRDDSIVRTPPETSHTAAGAAADGTTTSSKKKASRLPGNARRLKKSADGTRILYDACPLCHASEIRNVGETDCTQHPLYRKGLPRRMRWVRCRRCSHTFTEGYFTEEALRLLLAKANTHQTPGTEVDAGRWVAAHIVAAITSLRDALGGRWLDVGFGSGALLATAAEFGYDALGIDLRSSVVDRMRALGYEARCTDLQELEDAEGFDVISLADVLEHMPDPPRALGRVSRLLKPGGLVFVSSPNMDSLSWKVRDRQGSNPYWAELEHYHNFTREHLYGLLREAGLEPCRYGVSERYLAGMEVIARQASGQGAGDRSESEQHTEKPIEMPPGRSFDSNDQ